MCIRDRDFTAQGRVGLRWYDAGARSFYARQPVRSLNDLQGKTIRVQQSPTNVEMMRLLGGTATPMGFGDVYTALPVSYTHLRRCPEMIS